jgi:hypothetical protein
LVTVQDEKFVPVVGKPKGAHLKYHWKTNGGAP